MRVELVVRSRTEEECLAALPLTTCVLECLACCVNVALCHSASLCSLIESLRSTVESACVGGKSLISGIHYVLDIVLCNLLHVLVGAVYLCGGLSYFGQLELLVDSVVVTTCT